MRCLKRLHKNTPLVLLAIFCAFIIAVLAGVRLRYAHIFKPRFSPTCITLGDEEVFPTLAVFILAAGTMITGVVNVLMHSPTMRHVTLGILITLLTFGIGVLAYRAI